MKALIDSDVIYEQYDTEVLAGIPREFMLHSEMAEIERRFINGLIRYHKPRRLLELGVSQGAGTLVMLNSIADMPESKLVSIDVLDYYYRNPALSVGYLAEDASNKAQWALIKGKDPSEVLDSFDEKFDFCIIDTAHFHPIESLNFLCVLPYLADNAIVLIHDISAYTKWALNSFPQILLANALLFNTVVAEKLCPVDVDYLSHCNGVANIGAFQVTEDTRSHIGNVFSMLNLPWGIFPDMQLLPIVDSIKKHYNDNLVSVLIKAIELNLRLVCGDFNKYVLWDLKEALKPLAEMERCQQLIFYGYGKNSKNLLKFCEYMNVRLPDEIWDINKGGSDYCGIPVVAPEFESLSHASNTEICVVNTVQEHWVKVDVNYKFRERMFYNVINTQDIKNALRVRQYLHIMEDLQCR